MKLIFLLIFLAGNFFAGAETTISELGTYHLFGRDYVLITQWARVHKVDLKWLVKDKQLRATTQNFRLYFEMDSFKSQINGINVSLCLPVVLQKGNVFISRVDVDETLRPLLFPKKMAEGETIKTICLDAGHGGTDPGNIDGRMQEKKYTLLLAEELEHLLKAAGFKVVQTREHDEKIELAERPKISNRNKADLFVSLHFNSAARKSVQGAEVFCLTPEGTISSNGGKSASAYPGHDQNGNNILLAYEMQKALVKNLDVEDRGVKRSQFMVLLTTKMPAILIESGFMSNPIESKRIYDPAYRKKMAQAIVDGILAYQKIVERKPA